MQIKKTQNYSIIILANILSFNNPYSDFLKLYIHMQIMQKATSQFLKPLAFWTFFLVCFFKKINKPKNADEAENEPTGKAQVDERYKLLA